MGPKKDPNKPKGRMSAYAYFVQQKRKDYRDEGKEVDFIAFTKECSEEWKDEDLDKSEFEKKADEDKIRYTKAMKEYTPRDSGAKGKKSKKGKDPNQPKRAMSAFFYFAGEMRPEYKKKDPGATVGDLAKKLGAAWKKMSADDKAPYEKSAAGDRVRYSKDMELFKKGIPPKKATVEDEEEDVYSDED